MGLMEVSSLTKKMIDRLRTWVLGPIAKVVITTDNGEKETYILHINDTLEIDHKTCAYLGYVKKD